MKMGSSVRRSLRSVVAFCVVMVPLNLAYSQAPQKDARASTVGDVSSYERITAYLRGVYGPRGYFNMVVGLYCYKLDGLYGAQFNIKPGLMVLDIAPGYPRVSVAQIHHVEMISGYSPGLVEIREIRPDEFSESGPGWRKIQPPQSKHAIVRWIKQNFVNHHY